MSIRPLPSLVSPHSHEAAGLVDLVEAYRLERLGGAEAHRLEAVLNRLVEVTTERSGLAFLEAFPVDDETLCLIFTGESQGLCSLPDRASLLLDQSGSVTGGILFTGLRVEPLVLG